MMDFPGHFEQIFQQLNHQRVHGQLCDCVIVVSGRHFKAHRAVLAACSTHFRALFSAPGGGGGGGVVRLDSEVVTAEAFSALMEMMYTSTLTLGDCSVMDVLLAASHLHLNPVVKACKRYLTAPGSPRHPGASVAAGDPRLQRSFLLQQLGLSIVSSALSEEADEDARGAGPRDVHYPPRRLHRRKQACSSARSGPRPRLTPPGEELLSPDWREDSKADVTVIAGDEAAAQELPSQSDGGRAGKTESPPSPREGGGDDDGEVRHTAVVVKNEPLGSPEPADGASDVTSQAEGSDQVEPVGEKLELSPEGSEHSFSEPPPSSDLLLSEVRGSAGGAEDPGGGGARERGACGYLNFDPSAAAECALDREPPRFLFGPDPAPVLLPPPRGLLSAEAQEFPGLRADAFLVRPLHDASASSAPELLAMDHQRTDVGVHFARACAGGLGFPSYRRIAPKLAPGGAAPASSPPDGTGRDHAGHSGSGPRPQLTRASADVLSKCKKALSEHNVLVVEGARKYACRICCKTFLTLTDCKKHIRVHTGEKPYACLKCGKRFSQSSHLYKHSKTTCLRWQGAPVPGALL